MHSPYNVGSGKPGACAQMMQGPRQLIAQVGAAVFETLRNARVDSLAEHGMPGTWRQSASQVAAPDAPVRKIASLQQKVQLVPRHIRQNPAPRIKVNPESNRMVVGQRTDFLKRGWNGA